MKSLTIGRAARLGGVGVETMRFYEREGLIPEPPRTFSGYRQYPQETVSRVRFIKRAQELGFTLKEVRELLSFRASPRASCRDVKEKAGIRMEDIDRKIEDLRRMKRALSKLMAACEGRGSVSECPILDAMER